MLDVAEKLMKCGSLELDPETRVLSGPRGQVRLAPVAFSVAEELMRRPGRIVPIGDFVSAAWRNADNEPDFAEDLIRHEVKRLRSFIELANGGSGRGRVEICCERTVGYFIGKRR